MNINFSFLLFFLISCTSHHPHGHNESNKHMHKKSHEELIKVFDDKDRDEWQRPTEVIKYLGKLKNKNIIDIGAGSGYFTKFFVQAEGKVVAADVDSTFLEHVKNKIPKAKARLIAFDDPKMNDKEFDIAFTCNTYHHIDNRVTYLKKVLNGLKKNGTFVVVDFKPISENIGPALKMRIPIDVVVEEMVSAGFKNVKVNNDLLLRQYIITGDKIN